MPARLDFVVKFGNPKGGNSKGGGRKGCGTKVRDSTVWLRAGAPIIDGCMNEFVLKRAKLKKFNTGPVKIPLHMGSDIKALVSQENHLPSIMERFAAKINHGAGHHDILGQT